MAKIDKRNWNPGELLRVSGGYWQTCALHTGIKLDIFTKLGGDSINAVQLANELKADERALTMLLDALCAMRLLSKSGGGDYKNTPEARYFLCKDSGDYLGYIIMHHHFLMDSWRRLDEAVINGRPTRKRAFQADSVQQESFLMGMFNMGVLAAPKIVEYLDLTRHRRLLDLGGGPGTFAVHFCMQNPKLETVVFDLPGSEKFARRSIEKFGLEGRIEFAAGDFNQNELPGEYDVIWMSHILHSEGPDACRKLLGKAAAALNPSGEIIIHDFILEDQKDRPLFPALFSLNMLLGTDQGRAYSQSEIIGMLNSVGIAEVRRTDFSGPTESGILIGRKRG